MLSALVDLATDDGTDIEQGWLDTFGGQLTPTKQPSCTMPLPYLSASANGKATPPSLAQSPNRLSKTTTHTARLHP